MAPLTPKQREIYERVGAVFPLSALPASAATELGKTVANCFIGGDGRFTQECAHMCYGWADQLVRNPAMLDAAQSIIGENILVWETTCWVKFPAGFAPEEEGDSSRSEGGFVSFGWHQDTAFWGIAPDDQVVTAWIALSDVPASSGPVMFAPGTHVGPWLPQTQTEDQPPGDLWAAIRGQHVPIKAVLRAGEFMLFHGRLAQ